MSNDSKGDLRPYNRQEMVDRFQSAERDGFDQGKVGLEWEVLTLDPLNELNNISFRDRWVATGPDQFTRRPGLETLLQEIQQVNDWKPQFEIMNNEYRLKGIEQPGKIASLQTEYGAAFELASNPHRSLHDLGGETQKVMTTTAIVIGDYDYRFANFSYHPTQDPWTVEPAPRLRYLQMTSHMDERAKGLGAQGVAWQYNFDVIEGHMPEQMRALGFVSGLLPAAGWNGPFENGQRAEGNVLSLRATGWSHLKGHTGPLDIALEPGFSYDKYMDFLENTVPMYIKTGKNINGKDTFVDAYNHMKSDYMPGGVHYHEGADGFGCYTASDGKNHLKAAQFDIRFSTYGVIEYRPNDGGTLQMGMANAAFLTGIVYDPEALRATNAVLDRIGVDDFKVMRERIATDGLRAKAREDGPNVGDVLKELYSISEAALERRNIVHPETGKNEVSYLGPLKEVLDHGYSRAETMVARYNKGASIYQLLEESLMGPRDLVIPQINGDRLLDETLQNVKKRRATRKDSIIWTPKYTA